MAKKVGATTQSRSSRPGQGPHRTALAAAPFGAWQGCFCETPPEHGDRLEKLVARLVDKKDSVVRPGVGDSSAVRLGGEDSGVVRLGPTDLPPAERGETTKGGDTPRTEQPAKGGGK